MPAKPRRCQGVIPGLIFVAAQSVGGFEQVAEAHETALKRICCTFLGCERTPSFTGLSGTTT
jgi:hypothetical protein